MFVSSWWILASSPPSYTEACGSTVRKINSNANFAVNFCVEASKDEELGLQMLKLLLIVFLSLGCTGRQMGRKY